MCGWRAGGKGQGVARGETRDLLDHDKFMKPLEVDYPEDSGNY